MKKKGKMLMWIIIAVAVMLVAYIIYKSLTKSAQMRSGQTLTDPNLPAGCYPLEEVHESGTAGEMWVSIIPLDANGESTIRPDGNAISIGGEISISNTGSALDSTYVVRSIWYDVDGKIGSFRVDIPAGYNFNYTATQGGDPRDTTYFGVGHICLIS